ncbi:MAG: DnaD domain protein [Ruminococcus sp.]|nr:DnaD domain protein [Ruminococcus sp.]
MDLTIHNSGFGQMFGVPNIVVDQYLKLATPSQLKVLLYLLRHSGEPLQTETVARALSIPTELAEESVLFWQQTDLFAPVSVVYKNQAEQHPVDDKPQPDHNPANDQEYAPPLNTSSTAKAEEIPSKSTESNEKKTHISKKEYATPLSSAKNGELSPTEIAAALEKSEDLKNLFCMSEQQMGRPLRHVEQKALIWMHDYYNIGSDIILTVLLYCKSIDKCSVSYAESIIIAWWNDGLQTLSQVTEAINDMEHRRSFTGKIQKLFEMQRRPTPKQQDYINQWQDQNIPMELITYAYEKTLEGTENNKLSFEYLNKILTRWVQAGYQTREDVDTKDQPPVSHANAVSKSKRYSDKQVIPESEHADDYRSFIYNIDE